MRGTSQKPVIVAVLLVLLLTTFKISLAPRPVTAQPQVTGVGPWTEQNNYGSPTTQPGEISNTGIAILGVSCVTNAAYVYCIGGQNGTGTDISDVFYAQLSPSGSVGAWTETTDYGAMSGTSGSAGIGTEWPSCVEYSASVYCVGGATNSGIVSKAFYAQLSSSGVGPWTETTDYGAASGTSGNGGVATFQLACVTENGYIYCTGGDSSKVFYAQLSSSGVGPWTETTDYGAASGSSGSGGVTIDSNACVADSGYIYCIGGTASFKAVSDVFYAPLSSSGVGAWTQSTDYGATSGSTGSGGIPIYGTACVLYSPYVICINGDTTNNAGTAGVYYGQDEEIASWYVASNSFGPGYWLNCVELYGYIYCWGAGTPYGESAPIQPTAETTTTVTTTTTTSTPTGSSTSESTSTTTEPSTSITVSSSTTIESTATTTESTPTSTTPTLSTTTSVTTSTSTLVSTPTSETATTTSGSTTASSGSSDLLIGGIVVLLIIIGGVGYLLWSRSKSGGKPEKPPPGEPKTTGPEGTVEFTPSAYAPELGTEPPPPPPPEAPVTFTPSTYAPELGPPTTPPPRTIERPPTTPPPPPSPVGTTPVVPPITTHDEGGCGCVQHERDTDQAVHVDVSNDWLSKENAGRDGTPGPDGVWRSQMELAMEDYVKQNEAWDPEWLGSAVALSHGAVVGGSVDAGAKVWVNPKLWLEEGEQRRLDATSPVDADATGTTTIDITIEAPAGSTGTISAAALTALRAHASVLEVPEDLWESLEQIDILEKFVDIFLNLRPDNIPVFWGKNWKIFVDSLKKIKEAIVAYRKAINSNDLKKAAELLKDIEKGREVIKEFYAEFGPMIIALIIEKGGKWLWVNANVEVEAHGRYRLTMGSCPMPEDGITRANASRELVVDSGELKEPPKMPAGVEREFTKVSTRYLTGSCTAATSLRITIEGEVKVEGKAKEGGEGNASLESLWAAAWVCCCSSPDEGSEQVPDFGYAFRSIFTVPSKVAAQHSDDEPGVLRKMIISWMDTRLQEMLTGAQLSCPSPETEERLKEILSDWYKETKEKWGIFAGKDAE